MDRGRGRGRDRGVSGFVGERCTVICDRGGVGWDGRWGFWVVGLCQYPDFSFVYTVQYVFYDVTSPSPFVKVLSIVQ